MVGIGHWAVRGVYVSDSLTLDFDQWTEPIPGIHFAFRVGEPEFDALLQRLQAAGIALRTQVHGPIDHQIDSAHGGRIVYWNEPDGHQWEMLTLSCARKPENFVLASDIPGS